MCREVKCSKCSKASWAGVQFPLHLLECVAIPERSFLISHFTTFKNVGCGMHLDSVFANIRVDQRCFCGYTEKELEVAMTTAGMRGPYPKGASGAGCIII
jgi:hypothetical protein